MDAAQVDFGVLIVFEDFESAHFLVLLNKADEGGPIKANSMVLVAEIDGVIMDMVHKNSCSKTLLSHVLRT